MLDSSRRRWASSVAQPQQQDDCDSLPFRPHNKKCRRSPDGPLFSQSAIKQPLSRVCGLALHCGGVGAVPDVLPALSSALSAVDDIFPVVLSAALGRLAASVSIVLGADGIIGALSLHAARPSPRTARAVQSSS